MRVLAAFDGSSCSRFAVNGLRELPCHGELDLLLVTVSQTPLFAGQAEVGFGSDVSQYMAAQQAADGNRLRELAELIGSEFRSLQTHLLAGPAGVEIVELSKAENADLIVCGALGHSTISRVLLGSVSDSIATGAQCSTLVIRPPTLDGSDPSSEAKLPEPKLPARVLVGVGNAESDGRLIDLITEMQLPVETEVELVCVMETQPGYEVNLIRKASAYWSQVHSTAARHIESMREELETAGYRARTALVEAPHVGAALVEHAGKRQCDLIIVGDQRESIVTRVLLGSTSRHVLRQAACSVLIAR